MISAVRSSVVWATMTCALYLLAFDATGTVANASCENIAPQSAWFSQSWVIASDQAQEFIFAIDPHRASIIKYGDAGEVIHSFGSRGSGEGQFQLPLGLAIAPNGNIFVTDMELARVQVFSGGGDFITTWGDPGSGPGQLRVPRGIAISASNAVFVADQGNSRIQRFTLEGEFVLAWGSFGHASGQFTNLFGIAVDGSGNVYVPDDDGRVQVFSETGVFLRSFGSRGVTFGQLINPSGVAVTSSGEIFVADRRRGIVTEFNASGEVQCEYGGWGSLPGEFRYPLGICLTTQGRSIAIMDAGNERIQVLALSTAIHHLTWSGVKTIFHRQP